MTGKKYIYAFNEGNKDMKSLLGGKGANLAEMTNIGIPVPPGITITTEACIDYFKEGNKLPGNLEEQIWEYMKALEETLGKKFGDNEDPLLFSVRSGSVFSMPGMMDTVLNLGLNDQAVEGLAKKTEERRFAFDCYRRFIQMFSNVVLDIEHHEFEIVLDALKNKKGVEQDNELEAADLEALVADYKKLVKKVMKKDFPQDPKEQLLLSVEAVFRSWNNERAKVYRRINKIDDNLGTAVNIQAMVFGNLGPTSGTGVAFTRNPSNGENKLYGEYLINAQGEDVVAGIRTPQPISQLENDMPHVYEDFVRITKKLESDYKDMQDIEFTVQEGTLYILQTRTGKRTVQAAINIAVDLVNDGIISKEEALMRIQADQLDQMLHTRIDPEAKLNIIAKGLPASPGAASGHVVFNANEAEKRGIAGEDVVLVRTETTPDDIHGIIQAKGILTSRGGMTSHAAVVARGMGKPCVCGAETLKINYADNCIKVGDIVINKGDYISIDGTTGHVILGEVPMIDPEISENFNIILDWADEIKKMDVRANADNPEDAEKAKEFGAKGIGLCRTEHMFMAQDRLPTVQQMILSEDLANREKALEKLLPIQEEDFYGILKSMAGFPVTIRLLDPPLHEFLPNYEELLIEVTELRVRGNNEELKKEKEELLRKVKELEEINPMLGHRGCRLGISYPEIYKMQTEAIFRACARLTKENVEVHPEVEIPLAISCKELEIIKEMIDQTAVEVKKEFNVTFEYIVAAMIELPRAAMTADKFAEQVELFSFGTNDLTQTTLGFSRDDAEGKFMPTYIEKKIFPESPFIVLDRDGVGELMKIAVEKGRKVKPDLEIGICGEHGGEPSSVEFCHMIGLDFVSCSPFRVPIARLAAAQAAINHK
ncbi:MAG: pyruvate, phosphate dikinase [Eubacteriales bacterium]|nr:pyruvate, phosphate dikinase [Eubacteriales bacterium]